MRDPIVNLWSLWLLLFPFGSVGILLINSGRIIIAPTTISVNPIPAIIAVILDFINVPSLFHNSYIELVNNLFRVYNPIF